MEEKVSQDRETITVLLVIRTLMQALACCKMFHWSTTTYALHQATGTLADALYAKMDTLVESMLSKAPSGTLTQMRVELSAASSENFYANLYLVERTLKALNAIPEFANDTAILNLRDDILISINQFQYLAHQFSG